MKKKKTEWRDPIVEEIYRHWEEYAKKFDFDLQKIFFDLRRQQEESREPVVSFVPKPCPSRQSRNRTRT